MMKRFTILLMTLLLTTLGAQAQEDDRQQTISGQVIEAYGTGQRAAVPSA